MLKSEWQFIKVLLYLMNQMETYKNNVKLLHKGKQPLHIQIMNKLIYKPLENLIHLRIF